MTIRTLATTTISNNKPKIHVYTEWSLSDDSFHTLSYSVKLYSPRAYETAWMPERASYEIYISIVKPLLASLGWHWCQKLRTFTQRPLSNI